MKTGFCEAELSRGVKSSKSSIRCRLIRAGHHVDGIGKQPLSTQTQRHTLCLSELECVWLNGLLIHFLEVNTAGRKLDVGS